MCDGRPLERHEQKRFAKVAAIRMTRDGGGLATSFANAGPMAATLAAPPDDPAMGSAEDCGAEPLSML
jgi:hypothetical protein